MIGDFNRSSKVCRQQKRVLLAVEEKYNFFLLCVFWSEPCTFFSFFFYRFQIRQQNFKLTEYWYAHFGTNTFQHLMSVADQPFPELRVAILLVFQALAFQPWGQTIMNDHPGFQEEGKEGKYVIIQILADSPTVRDIFGDPYYVQLKTYCSEGPFYVRAQAQVAMEGES